MNAILKRLQQLGEDDLLSLSEAIDVELERRQSRFDEVPESARRRALAREHSYRHCNGASAPPIRAVGLRDIRRNRAA
ncbi:MAG: hypothetical protein ABFC77_07915 [Thermoguttaceae bacterium]